MRKTGSCLHHPCPAVGAADPGGCAQQPATPPRSAPLTNLRYEITFDSTTAASRTIKVGMTFDVAGPGPGAALVPGLDARRVRAELVRALGLELRARPRGERPRRSRGTSWTTTPGGCSPAGAKSVSRAVRLPGRHARQRDGLVAARFRAVQRHEPAALSRGAGHRLRGHRHREDRADVDRRHRHDSRPSAAAPTGRANYHDLVDMPFFVGRFDYDSTQVAGVWTRLATYPAGALTGQARRHAVGRRSAR